MAEHEYIQGVAEHDAVPSVHQMHMLAGICSAIQCSALLLSSAQPHFIAASLPPGETSLPAARITCITPCLVQVSKERDLLHSRLESLDAELERERGLHRRELARKAKEVQQVGTAACTCSAHVHRRSTGQVMASAELVVCCRCRWRWRDCGGSPCCDEALAACCCRRSRSCSARVKPSVSCA